MTVKSITAYDNNTKQLVNDLTFGSAAGNIDPQQTVRVKLDCTTNSKDVTVYRIDTVYDVFEMGGQSPIFKDQISTTYMVVSTVTDWLREVYSNNQGNAFIGTKFSRNQKNYMHTNSTNSTGKSDMDYTGHVFATFPDTVMISTSNPSAVSLSHYRIANTNTRMLSGTSSRVKGLYFTLDKDADADLKAFAVPAAGQGNKTPAQYGEEVNVVANYGASKLAELGLAAIDQNTGDILHYGFYDYYHPLEKRWYRGGANGYAKHADGGKNSDGAFKGYTLQQVQDAGNQQVTDPADSTLKPLNSIDGYKTRTHVVWTYDEYMAGEDYNKQSGQETVRYVSRDKVGLDVDGNIVYKYNFVLVKVSNALVFGDDGSCSMSTPIPGIYVTAGYKDVSWKSNTMQQWLAYDGKTKLGEAKAVGQVVVASDEDTNPLTPSVPVTFQVVDDLGLQSMKKQYNDISNQFASYKESDFKQVDFKGSQVNPYVKLQDALGEVLLQSATTVNYATADSFSSNKIDVLTTIDSRYQIGELAYKVATQSDPITPEVALKASLYQGHYYYDDAHQFPVLTATKLAESDVSAITTQTVDGQKLSVGTATVQNVKVVKDIDGNWHYLNAPKMETTWDTTSYSAPYRVKTSTQVGANNNTPVYEQVTYAVFKDEHGVHTNTVANTHKIIKPNSFPSEYRNEMEKAVDTMHYWQEIALKNIAGSGATDIVKQVRDDFNSINTYYINYNVLSFNNLKEIANEAMSLVTTTWVNSERPKMDPINKDQQMKNPVTGELLWEQDPVYSTTASALQVEVAIRNYNIAKSRLVKMDYSANKLANEIAWSLNNSALDNLDLVDIKKLAVTEGAPDEFDNKTFTEVKSTTAKFGTVENGVLVNKTAEGQQAYTAESWANYINCLGNAIYVAQNATAKANDRSEAFFARKNLMLAENNLDPFTPVDPDPQPGNDITVSGTTFVCTDLVGVNHNKGIIGIEVVTDFTLDDKGHIVGGTVVATSTADGSFTATIPAGTKEIGFRGATTIDRVVTLAGDTNITGAEIPVVICDYNRDTFVNGMDTAKYSKALSVYDVNMDFNGDGFVNGMDTGVYAKFINQTVTYNPLTIA